MGGDAGRSLGKRVVVIDDDDVMLLSCREVLTRSGYEVETFDNGEAGASRVRQEPPPVLLVDLKMPGIDGFEVIRRVRSSSPQVVIVVITGHATIATAVDAMKAGAYDFLPKPFTPAELRLIIDRSHERWALARESELLRKEKEVAERRFVTFLTHQLKAPLAATRQYLDVLLYLSGTELPERAGIWIGRCRSRVDEMLAMIDDWLTLARLDKATMSRTEATTDLALLVRQAVETARTYAESAGVLVFTEVTQDTWPIRGDSTSVGMVVSNLLNNAIKYNRKGGRVTLRLTGGSGQALLEVQDTGIGIPDSAMPELFHEFHRVKSPATVDIPGTGLGLAICRKIVLELGGTIEVASLEGQGTTFSVRLPLASVVQDSPKGAP